MDDLPTVERRRLRALVAGDLDTANALHHEQFQLVTPGAATLTKAEYLGAIADGALRYLLWDPEDIVARVVGDAACLRYAASLRVLYDGNDSGAGRYWHTDYYERHADAWQVVFSHATGPIRTVDD